MPTDKCRQFFYVEHIDEEMFKVLFGNLFFDCAGNGDLFIHVVEDSLKTIKLEQWDTWKVKNRDIVFVRLHITKCLVPTLPTVLPGTDTIIEILSVVVAADVASSRDEGGLHGCGKIGSNTTANLIIFRCLRQFYIFALLLLQLNKHLHLFFLLCHKQRPVNKQIKKTHKSSLWKHSGTTEEAQTGIK